MIVSKDIGNTALVHETRTELGITSRNRNRKEAVAHRTRTAFPARVVLPTTKQPSRCRVFATIGGRLSARDSGYDQRIARNRAEDGQKSLTN